MDPSTDKAYILKFNKAFGGLVDFLGSFNGFPRCRPSLEVALKSNHSAYIFGVLDYFISRNSSQFVDTHSNSS